MIFLGDRVVPSSYNALTRLSRMRQSAIRTSEIATRVDKAVAVVAAGPIGRIVSQPQFGLDPLDYRHPIVAPFRGRERAGLLTRPSIGTTGSIVSRESTGRGSAPRCRAAIRSS